MGCSGVATKAAKEEKETPDQRDPRSHTEWDMAGDGPQPIAEVSIQDTYWTWVADIWMRNNNPNQNRLSEIKEKYQNRAYEF